jgi:hypothetical protein
MFNSTSVERGRGRGAATATAAGMLLPVRSDKSIQIIELISCHSATHLFSVLFFFVVVEVVVVVIV